MVTIEQRRKTDRERLKRWRKNKLAAGNKQIQLMLTPEAQAVLKQEKERTGEPFVSIIHRAIIGLRDDVPEFPVDKQKEIKLKQKAAHDLILTLNREGKDEWQISKILNDEGVPTFDEKGEWYPSTIRSFLQSATR
jgi:hypothetical protein